MRIRKETAHRFRHPEDRRTYVLAHGLLRHILARYLRSDPARLKFSRGEYGKPYLTAGGLEFNLSHSGDRVAISVARSGVGVDLEEVKVQPIDVGLVSECFTESEQHWLERCTDDPYRGFFRLWTLKEAVLKADGRGLGAGCHQAALHMSSEGDSATVVLGNVTWRAYELQAGSDFCLAVAAREIRNVRIYPIRHVGQLKEDFEIRSQNGRRA